MQFYGWKPYVPVAERRRRATKKMATLKKKGIDIQPVVIEGRKIAKTFWGEAWCHHLESFSDFENRLPRGRTYVRNGSVCHLEISKGQVQAKVSGSEIYNVRVVIKTIPGQKWLAAKRRCAGQIGSLLELLQGQLSDNVMQVVTDREQGLFPLPGEMSFSCDCPDWASMCKHIAAVLYGVGARLDSQPHLLFRLRGVNHEELIDEDAAVEVSAPAGRGKARRLVAEDLADVFGIDIDEEKPEASSRTAKKGRGKTKVAPVRAAMKPGSSTSSSRANQSARPAAGSKAKTKRRRTAQNRKATNKPVVAKRSSV